MKVKTNLRGGYTFETVCEILDCPLEKCEAIIRSLGPQIEEGCASG
jgi:hypothetical protein